MQIKISFKILNLFIMFLFTFIIFNSLLLFSIHCRYLQATFSDSDSLLPLPYLFHSSLMTYLSSIWDIDDLLNILWLIWMVSVSFSIWEITVCIWFWTNLLTKWIFQNCYSDLENNSETTHFVTIYLWKLQLWNISEL